MSKGEKMIVFLLVVLNVVVIVSVLEARRRLLAITGEVDKFKTKIDKFKFW